MNKFMVSLLRREDFDGFLFKEGFLRLKTEYSFNGRIFEDFEETSVEDK
ncbi:MAG: hypothetical protein K6B75_08380 [Lachnospiraceae bacterium]|nr:hypothetical protein [Lachnospiraceae bacterium]